MSLVMKREIFDAVENNTIKFSLDSKSLNPSSFFNFHLLWLEVLKNPIPIWAYVKLLTFVNSIYKSHTSDWSIVLFICSSKIGSAPTSLLSHLVSRISLLFSHFLLPTSYFQLHTSHFILLTSHFILYSPWLISEFK